MRPAYCHWLGGPNHPLNRGIQDAAKEYELAVASLAELIHHTAFREDASDLVPLTEIAIQALHAEPPNLGLATDLILEIEGRLFMRSEIMKYPFLSRWKLKQSTPRVSAVDIVTRALPLSFGMFIFVTSGLLVLKWLLHNCSAGWISGCELANAFVSAAYVIATIWGFFGGLASVMLRRVTTERLPMNQLRGLYYTTIYKPWLGSMFAAIVYFGVVANIVPLKHYQRGALQRCVFGRSSVSRRDWRADSPGSCDEVRGLHQLTSQRQITSAGHIRGARRPECRCNKLYACSIT